MDGDDIRDPDSPPTAEEIAAAEALRDALATSAPNSMAREAPNNVPATALGADPRANASADFARAVALSHGASGRGLSESEHRAIVDRAIVRGDARRTATWKRNRGVVITLAGALAVAAAILLFVARSPQVRELSEVEPLVPVRSTQPLFREPFARAGGESARIDRIASARGADLRDNRFATWGVR